MGTGRRAAATLLALAALLLAPSPAPAAPVRHASVAAAEPTLPTPNVEDGTVLALARVGPRVLAGGDFRSVLPPGERDPDLALARPYLLAFDPLTGAVDRGFLPGLDGEVRALLPGPEPHTVYAAGDFRAADGVPAWGVALLDTRTGRPVPGFRPPFLDGSGWDVVLVRGHLVLAGTFTRAGGRPHAGLVALDPRTGALQDWLDVQLSGHHQWTGQPGQARAPVGGRYLDATPDGSTVVVLGNFTSADGLPRDQVLQLSTTAAAATVDTSWATAGFTAACAQKYDAYVRGVSISPDGSYFVVVTTGGGGRGLVNSDGTRSLCDTASRWQTAATGSNVAPTWVQRTGNDSLESVAVTGAAVYVGGHQRWLNNAQGQDDAGPGAVPRPGVAALDPVSGVPFSWNPGRNPRGAGAYALLATAGGLYVGSDTTWVGNRRFYRGRVAGFPLSGVAPPSTVPAGLPGPVHLLGPASAPTSVVRRWFDGTRAGPATPGPAGDLAGDRVRGAFAVGGTLFYGTADGGFARRAFDGRALGPEVEVRQPYDDPAWAQVRTGSGDGVYRGVVPDLYGARMPSVTGMAYRAGKLFYSLAGEPRLRWRAFAPESGIIGSEEFPVTGDLDLSGARGLLLSGSTLYWADGATGYLHAVDASTGVLSAATDRVVNRGVDWRANGLVLGP